MDNNLYFNGATKIKCEKLGKIAVAQDGAIFGGYVFHIDAVGKCSVFSLDSLKKVSEFILDKHDKIVPQPVLSIIDTKNKKAAATIKLVDYGISIEPEFVEVYDQKVYFADAAGHFYQITFE